MNTPVQNTTYGNLGLSPKKSIYAGSVSVSISANTSKLG